MSSTVIIFGLLEGADELGVPRGWLVEGTAHGLLLVRSMSGEILGHGDFLQAAHPDRIESRLVLRFKDGSRHDETVAFSQQRVFTMMSYRLVQRGPSFPETLEATLDRTTRSYKVRSTQKGKEETLSGSIELPPDDPAVAAAAG